MTYQTQWNPGDFAGQQVVVLNDWPASGSGFNNALLSYVEEGGTAVYIPTPRTSDASVLTAFGVAEAAPWTDQPDRVRDLRMDHPFFTDMFAQTPERTDLPAVESI